jgi:hypothetical protein
MPRSSDLDIVAPDDPILTSPSSTPKLKKKKIKKTVADIVTSDPNLKFRDRIADILGESKHSLTSFLVQPKLFKFEEQDLDEEILLVLRPHWFTNISWILTTILLLILPVFLLPSIAGFAANYRFITTLFYFLLVFIFAFEKFLSWYFNVFIITDERVIDIDFNNLIVKKFSEAKISMIQDVTSKVVGLFPTMFNYGGVLIQTAAEITEITFENVPNPEKVIKVLQQLRQEEEQEALEGRIN